MDNPQETKKNYIILIGSSETIRYTPIQKLDEEIVQM